MKKNIVSFLLLCSSMSLFASGNNEGVEEIAVFACGNEKPLVIDPKGVVSVYSAKKSEYQPTGHHLPGHSYCHTNDGGKRDRQARAYLAGQLTRKGDVVKPGEKQKVEKQNKNIASGEKRPSEEKNGNEVRSKEKKGAATTVGGRRIKGRRRGRK